MNYCPECGHHLAQYTTEENPQPTYYYLTLSMSKLRQFDLARGGDILIIEQGTIDEAGSYWGLREVTEPGRYFVISVDRPAPGMVNTALFILEKA